MYVKCMRQILVVSVLALLYGCQNTPQSDALTQSKLVGLPAYHKIDSVPFYPQQDFYCGPTTLAEVFNFHGENLTPSNIAPSTFTPKQQGTFQVEMKVASREHGFLPYSEQATLQQIISLVSDDIPIIVFQNVALRILPQWHYAVVIGYDVSKRELILHTGVTAEHSMSFELFERTWARGDYWMLAPLPVKAISDYLDPFVYINTAYDMLKLETTNEFAQNMIQNNSQTPAQPVALNFLKAAVKQWPQQWLAYFLIANYYIENSPEQALNWFDQGITVGKYHAAYLNNYSIALLNTNNYEASLMVINEAIARFGDLYMLIDTKAQLESILSERSKQAK